MIRVMVNGAGGKMGREVVKAVHNDPELTLVGGIDPTKAGQDVGTVAGIEQLGITMNASIDEVLDTNKPDVIVDLAYDKPIGTKFIAHHSDRLESRKQWLFAAPSAGMLTIDEGAENAMLVQNKSLLPAGITAVEGRFSRGEVVKIKNTSGKVIALGMPRYNSDALELIKGKKSQEIEQILGYEYGAVALHRDDMIVL